MALIFLFQNILKIRRELKLQNNLNKGTKVPSNILKTSKFCNFPTVYATAIDFMWNDVVYL